MRKEIEVLRELAASAAKMLEGDTGTNRIEELTQELREMRVGAFLVPVLKRIRGRMRSANMQTGELASRAEQDEADVTAMLAGKDVPIEVVTAVLYVLGLEMTLNIRDHVDGDRDELGWTTLYDSRKEHR